MFQHTAVIEDNAGRFWAVRSNDATPQAYLGVRVTRVGNGFDMKPQPPRLVRRAATRIVVGWL